MHRKISPLVVLGTRPEVIKLAPLIHAFSAADDIHGSICFTGQHADMAQAMLRYFKVEPTDSLDMSSSRLGLNELIGAMISNLDRLLDHKSPSCVIVQGDTASAFAGALAAFNRKIPILHVEAGLRTLDPFSPYPEETYRRFISIAASMHCAPTQHARNNLLAERVPPTAISVTGNTVIDALRWALTEETPSFGINAHSASGQDRPRRLLLVTGHRRENVGTRLKVLCEALRSVAAECDNVEIVWPVHLNPQVCEPVEQALCSQERVQLLPPQEYPQFVRLMHRACLIITDSGGVQEEACFLKKPMLITRTSTERPEALESGGAKLLPLETAAETTQLILAALEQLTHGGITFSPTCPFGDGHAAERIVEVVRNMHRT